MTKTRTRAAFSLILTFAAAVFITISAHAAPIDNAAIYVYGTGESPAISSVGGDWAVFALARSGAEVPAEYYSGYIDNVTTAVTSAGGVISERKYTEYSRVILALTAVGADPTNIGGYSLTVPLGDYESVIRQGLNGSVWALIALDSGGYPMPYSPAANTQATRDMYIDYILERECTGGGWSILGGTAEPDITAMTLAALSDYTDNREVSAAVERGLAALSAMQTDTGGYISDGVENAESAAQVVAALCELGIDTSDERFTKNGISALDNLMSFYDSASGGFKHKATDETAGQMASEQALYALAAVQLYEQGETLYNITSVNTDYGLDGRCANIRYMPITNAGKTFPDIADNKYKSAIEALSERGIIDGRTPDEFAPDASITRAEFAAVMIKGLGLPYTSADAFADVGADDWYNLYVNTAYAYGIVNGVSETEFDPESEITRAEAIVMTVRAAALAGMDTTTDTTASVSCPEWAAEAAAFAESSGIIETGGDMYAPASRAEVADMLYNMMRKANLL